MPLLRASLLLAARGRLRVPRRRAAGEGRRSTVCAECLPKAQHIVDDHKESDMWGFFALSRPCVKGEPSFMNLLEPLKGLSDTS